MLRYSVGFSAHAIMTEILYTIYVYIGWNDVTYPWSQYDRHFVGQLYRA